MRRLRSRRTGVVAVVVALCVVVPAAALAATTFKTGHYSGKTSQHRKLVMALSHTTGCTAKTESVVSYCLGTITQAYVTLKCPDGTTTNNYIDVDGSLNKLGVLSYTARGTSETTQRVYLKDSPHGTITGYVEFSQAESIEGTGPVCRSGKVTFVLHHT